MENQVVTYSINDNGNIFVGEGSTLEDAKRAAELAKHEIAASGCFGFELAVQLLKAGEKVARESWDGSGMYLILVGGDVIKHVIYKKEDLFADTPDVDDAIYLKTNDNKLTPWQINQADVLAEDWVII